MRPFVDRLNRRLLVLLGLLAVVAGVLLLLANLGVFGTDAEQTELLPQRLAAETDGQDWVAYAVAAGVAVLGLVLLLLGLAWLFRQLRTERTTHDLHLERDASSGTTTLSRGAVTDALEGEVESWRGVGSARAVFLHDENDPDLLLKVDLDGRAPVGQVHRRILEEAVPMVRQVLGMPGLHVVTRLEAAEHRRRAIS